MPDTVRHLSGVPVLVCGPEGGTLRDEDDALDVIGQASYLGAEWVALPAGRLDEGFFRLRTGIAGRILQKFVNYRTGLAIVGDISPHTQASQALRDLVRESDRGRHTWFVADLADLAARLGSGRSAT